VFSDITTPRRRERLHTAIRPITPAYLSKIVEKYYVE